MSGYDGVMHAVSDNTEWRWTIRACFDWMDKEEARGSETLWVDEKWIEMSTGTKPMKLKPLVGFGILNEKFFHDDKGRQLPNPGRVYYLMPDRPGVGRALDELDVPPTVFR